jgi:hypothetical protein
MMWMKHLGQGRTQDSPLHVVSVLPQLPPSASCLLPYFHPTSFPAAIKINRLMITARYHKKFAAPYRQAVYYAIKKETEILTRSASFPPKKRHPVSFGGQPESSDSGCEISS